MMGEIFPPFAPTTIAPIPSPLKEFQINKKQPTMIGIQPANLAQLINETLSRASRLGLRPTPPGFLKLNRREFRLILGECARGDLVRLVACTKLADPLQRIIIARGPAITGKAGQ
jgi:hypothetical protein